MALSNIIDKQQINFPFLDKPVNIYKLKNGHTVVIANKSGELVNISTWVKTGSINEDDTNTGISHFLEHLMFKGTPTYKAGEFDRMLESRGAIINAATWKDYTFYYVTIPKGENNEFLYKAIELHSDMMLKSIFPEEEIGPTFDPNDHNVEEKRERYVVIEEIRMRDDNHWTVTYDAMNDLMYKVHPYKRDVIGTADVIASVSRQTIMDYYKKWYVPGNMTTIAVGDFDTEEILEFIIKNFDFPEAEMPELPPYHQEEEQTSRRYTESTRKDINTGFAVIGFRGPKPVNLAENISVEILSLILGDGKSSRLYQNLIEKQTEHVFNVVGATQYEFKEGNVILVQANFAPDKKDIAMQLVEKQIENIYTSPITEAEFNKAKKRLKADFAEDAETVSEIGEAIGHCLTVCEDISCHVDYLKTINTIDVEFIQQTANKYLNLNRACISVLVPGE